MSTSEHKLECTIPVLPVRDLATSIAFYTKVLGFQLVWGGQPGSLICSVSKDGCSLMLSQLDAKSAGAWVWIGLQNDSLFHVYRERGVKVFQEPLNYSWAYEMKFADPDGNILWLGTETRTDIPVVDRTGA